MQAPYLRRFTQLFGAMWPLDALFFPGTQDTVYLNFLPLSRTNVSFLQTVHPNAQQGVSHLVLDLG